MEIDGQKIIEELDGEAMIYSEESDPTLREVGERLSLTVSMLRNFRDSLISIALTQGGIAAHQAQDVLKKSGYCYHFNSTFLAEIEGKRSAAWHCQDCGRIDAARLVPYR